MRHVFQFICVKFPLCFTVKCRNIKFSLSGELIIFSPRILLWSRISLQRVQCLLSLLELVAFLSFLGEYPITFSLLLMHVVNIVIEVYFGIVCWSFLYWMTYKLFYNLYFLQCFYYEFILGHYASFTVKKKSRAKEKFYVIHMLINFLVISSGNKFAL